MNRRNFVQLVTVGSGAAVSGLPLPFAGSSVVATISQDSKAKELRADVVIAGGGLGGSAAALAALRNNLDVILTEETDWIGGQLTQQGVPPDEHPWIETHGATALYRSYRTKVREYYVKN